jgi:hypothetical protein
MSEEERAALTAASAAKRANRVAARRDAEESARLGLTALLGQRLEEEAETVTERLRNLALSPDPGVALQGIKLWLERVHGRAVQPTADVTEERNPMVEAFASLSPEERRTLLRLAQPLPTDPDTASAEGL